MVGRLIRFFTENWTLKLAAVALAILLWLAVEANTPRRQRFGEVPVEVEVQDPDYRLARDPEPPTVSVTVVGPQSELLSLAGDPPRIVVPVDRVTDTAESQVVPLQWVRLPQNVRETRVEGIRPDTIRLYYERLVSRSLPVRVALEGRLPDGLTLVRPIATNPVRVEVSGPARALESLDSVPLLPVELSGLRSNTNVPTSVDSTALAPGVRFTPREVNVVLRVERVDTLPPLPPDTTDDGSTS